MATNAELLAEAKAAYHDLQIGKSARVFVDQNGERVEYTAANRAALAAYIQQLSDLVDPPACARGPMRVFF